MTRMQQRNREIYANFLDLLGTAPLMQIYAKIAVQFWLSEDRIRAIVAQEHRRVRT